MNRDLIIKITVVFKLQFHYREQNIGFLCGAYLGVPQGYNTGFGINFPQEFIHCITLHILILWFYFRSIGAHSKNQF